MKTSELTGFALDWAVAKCEGVNVQNYESPNDRYGVKWRGKCYSQSWEYAGEIIEREKLTLMWRTVWSAVADSHEDIHVFAYGPTALVAAMRCFVASKLGDEVDIPKELL